jgi:hypothetical protein
MGGIFHHWDFVESFSPIQATLLMDGVDPRCQHNVDDYDLILGRMKRDYEKTCADYWVSAASDQHTVLEKRLPSVALEAFERECFHSGNTTSFRDWLEIAPLEYGLQAFSKSDFDRQVFSREAIQRWLACNGLSSVYQFVQPKASFANAVESEGASGPLSEHDTQLGKRERETLLTIIATLCNHAGIDYTKAAKTAGLIQKLAADMGLSIGETTIEGHLKKIPNALAGRMK